MYFSCRRTPHADMEGFLRSSFLLRLVSFSVVVVKLWVRGSGGQELNSSVPSQLQLPTPTLRSRPSLAGWGRWEGRVSGNPPQLYVVSVE